MKCFHFKVPQLLKVHLSRLLLSKCSLVKWVEGRGYRGLNDAVPTLVPHQTAECLWPQISHEGTPRSSLYHHHLHLAPQTGEPAPKNIIMMNKLMITTVIKINKLLTSLWKLSIIINLNQSVKGG